VLLRNPASGNNIIIYFEKDGEWFVLKLQPGLDSIQEHYDVLSKIVSTFAFTAKEGIKVPTEYELLKDIDRWQVTYQLKSDTYSSQYLQCADGRKGTSAQDYLFGLNSDGFGEPPGDIDTPYRKVVQVLEDNGWTECGIPQSQQDPTNGTKYVFIKNNKLIGISKHYSMGVGNSLTILIQYSGRTA